jgi:hypothetical protein
MRRGLLFLGLLGALFGDAGCVAATPPQPASGPHAEDPAVRVAAFAKAEDEVLRDLAAIDRRLAARARLVPREDDLHRVAVAALVAGDSSVAVIDGTIDPFSFDARGRGLAAAKKRLDLELRDLPATSTGERPEPALEGELLRRLLDEETERLDEERQLPRSASALVRAVVETWTPPATPAAAAERDRWIARRLEEVRTSLADKPIDLGRARELDGALDALEHLLEGSGLQGGLQELVRLRDVLESPAGGHPTADTPDWLAVSRGIAAHIGVAGGAEEIERALANADVRLSAQAEAAVLGAGLTHDQLAKHVGPLMFPEASCADEVAGSPVRSMAAPPERTAACHLRHALASAHDDAAYASALVALHDHVVVARWALAVATGKDTLARAMASHRLVTRHMPDVTARLERIALARPVTAIGAGMAAAILVPTDRTHDAAALWSSLGDVPLDVIERKLH